MTPLRISIIVALALLGGCSALSTTGQDYAGVNFADVTLPNGEHWLVAGGKDETDTTFTIERASGDKVTYTTAYADATTPLSKVIEGQAARQERLISLLLQVINVPAPTP